MQDIIILSQLKFSPKPVIHLLSYLKLLLEPIILSLHYSKFIPKTINSRSSILLYLSECNLCLDGNPRWLFLSSGASGALQIYPFLNLLQNSAEALCFHHGLSPGPIGLQNLMLCFGGPFPSHESYYVCFLIPLHGATCLGLSRSRQSHEVVQMMGQLHNTDVWQETRHRYTDKGTRQTHTRICAPKASSCKESSSTCHQVIVV